jgi:RNA-binding protein YhbY
MKPLAIGDSVMYAARHHLASAGIEVDAQVGRFFWQGLKILRARALPDKVVVHLGTNGGITSNRLLELDYMLEGRDLLMLNIKAPVSWRDSSNRLLSQFAKSRNNVKLLNWSGIGGKHPEWFWNDQIHLRPEGAQAYSRLVTRHL